MLSRLEKNKKIIIKFVSKISNEKSGEQVSQENALQFLDIIINDNPYIFDFGVSKHIPIRFEKFKKEDLLGLYDNDKRAIRLSTSFLEDMNIDKLAKMVIAAFHELAHAINHVRRDNEEDSTYWHKLNTSEDLRELEKYKNDITKMYFYVFSDYLKRRNLFPSDEKDFEMIKKIFGDLFYYANYNEKIARSSASSNAMLLFKLMKEDCVSKEMVTKLDRCLENVENEMVKNQDDIIMLNKMKNVHFKQVKVQELFASIDKALPNIVGESVYATNDEKTHNAQILALMVIGMVYYSGVQYAKDCYKYMIENPIPSNNVTYECKKGKIVDLAMFNKLFHDSLCVTLQETTKKDRELISHEMLEFALSKEQVTLEMLEGILTDDDMKTFCRDRGIVVPEEESNDDNIEFEFPD